VRTAKQGDGVYARIAWWCPTCQPGPTPTPSRRTHTPTRAR
jgi:endonuclease VIII